MNVPLPMLAQRLRALSARRFGLAAWLWGEAGIGKTHTSRALLRGTPYRSLTLTATLPLPELVRALPRPARLRAWTRAALDSLQAGQTVTVPEADILAALLGQLAPFVLHLEDLHDADDARKALTVQLAAAVAHTRGAALLVSSRLAPPEDWPESALTLSLERLSPQDSAALLEARAGSTLPAGALAWVYEQARGNPLFTLEYFRSLARRGAAWNDGQTWHWRTPGGETLPLAVEALIEQALLEAGRSPTLQDVLDARAILGADATPECWARVAGQSAAGCADARSELDRAGLLHGQDFTHPLYREVTLRRLSGERRQLLSGRALEALADDPQAAAPFAPLAGLGPEGTLSWFMRAAQAAEGAGNEVVAAKFLGQASAYAPREQQTELALRAAQVLQKHDHVEALSLTQQALLVHPHHIGAICLAATLLARQGTVAEALALLSQLPADAPPDLALGQRLTVQALAGDHAGAAETWRTCEALRKSTDCEVLYQAAISVSAIGDQDTALAILEQGQKLPDLNAEQRCKLVSIRAAVCYRRGEYAEQELYSRQALALARESGNLRATASTQFNRHYALRILGRINDARHALEEAALLYARIGEHRRYAHVQVRVAELLSDLAEYPQAEDRLLEARDLLLPLGASEPLVDCQDVLAQLYLRWDVPHAQILALKHASEALDLAKRLRSPRNVLGGLLICAGAHTNLKQAAEGLTLALQALELAHELESPWGIYAAQTYRAQALEALGQRSAALDTYRLALELSSALHIEEEQVAMQLELARLEGNAEGISQALGFFEERSLISAANRAREYGRQLAGSLPAALASPLARLDVLGDMRFGPPGAGAAVRGRKRRELLACLLDSRLRGRPDMPRLTLTDALYPGTGESQAASALKELIHQTRAALGPGVIQTTEGGYALGEVQSDAELFLLGGDTALWRGPYLAGEEPEQGGLMAETLYGVLSDRAQVLCDENPAEAARIGRLLCEASPYDPAALALTLRALRAAGNHRSLGRFYVSARQGFEEVGEQLPADWAAFLETHEVTKQAPA